MTATQPGMTRSDALAMLVDPDRAVVDVTVCAAVAESSVWPWYGLNPPVEPIRVGRRKVWRTSDLRTFFGLGEPTAPTPPIAPLRT